MKASLILNLIALFLTTIGALGVLAEPKPDGWVVLVFVIFAMAQVFAIRDLK